MRDTIKNEAYFKKSIDLTQKLIVSSRQDIINNLIKSENISGVSRFIIQIEIAELISMYSAGYETSQLSYKLKAIIDSNYNHNTKFTVQYYYDFHVEYYWLFSLCFLLKIDSNYFNKLLHSYDKYNVHDYILDYIIHECDPKRVMSDNLFLPKPYLSLLEVIREKDEKLAVKKLNNFLNKKWYQGLKKCYWYNTEDNIHDVYFGYWCFEAAAIAKIKNLDKGLIESKYFPGDLI
ncbi:MAG: PoNe immunity protein domain-containing protein [Saprospiraceae bacterium]